MSAMVNVMFIGGPAAGDIAQVAEGCTVWYHTEKQLNLLLHPDANHVPVDQRITQYIRFDIQIEGGTMNYFRPSEWSGRQVMEELIGGYRFGVDRQKEEEARR